MNVDVDGDVVGGEFDFDFYVGSDWNRYVIVGVVVCVHVNVTFGVVFCSYWRCCLLS